MFIARSMIDVGNEVDGFTELEVVWLMPVEFELLTAEANDNDDLEIVVGGGRGWRDGQSSGGQRNNRWGCSRACHDRRIRVYVYTYSNRGRQKSRIIAAGSSRTPASLNPRE